MSVPLAAAAGPGIGTAVEIGFQALQFGLELLARPKFPSAFRLLNAAISDNQAVLQDLVPRFVALPPELMSRVDAGADALIQEVIQPGTGDPFAELPPGSGVETERGGRFFLQRRRKRLERIRFFRRDGAELRRKAEQRGLI